MFTGLIESVGKVQSIRHISRGRMLEIAAPQLAAELSIGDSVAVNGVCLTVTRRSQRCFSVDCLSETLQKTTTGQLSPGSSVNLERALSANMRFDGHLVQGHVNGTGVLKRIERVGEGRYLHIELGKELLKYCVAEGSIALQGISLTIAALGEKGISVNIIPHSWNNTSLNSLIIGSLLNIETDIVGRYVERLLGMGEKSSDVRVFSGGQYVYR